MKTISSLFLILITCIIFSAFGEGENGLHSSSGAPMGYAGDPAGGNKTCNTIGCHTGPQLPDQNGWITSNIPPGGYNAGTTYTITASAIGPGHSRFGFEISPQNSSGTMIGTMANLTTETKLVGSNKYITHTSAGNSGNGSRTWNFSWTAPSSGSGALTFYGAFNISNKNGSTSGDSIYKSTLTVSESLNSVFSFGKTKKQLEVFPNPVQDLVNIKLPEGDEQQGIVYIYNLKGSLEKTISVEAKKTISLSDLKTGVYLLELQTKKGSYAQKIIKH